MFHPLEKTNKEKEELNKIAQLPTNRKLKYLALFFISIGIILFLIMIIWFDDLSRDAIFTMRGCAGICAIIFLIIVGIYIHKINTIYHEQRFRNKQR